MDKPQTTPKDFFLWAGAMITLYASAVAFVSLIFDYLNYAFPDPLHYFASDPYQGGISYEMATLIVLFPLFLVFMRLIHRDIARDSSRADISLRRWALYLTLFLAVLTVAADLITLIMYFFNGDVPARFLLKVLVILLVAGAGFLHFFADSRGYWNENPSYARTLGWATGALVVITIVAGFFIVGTPWQARLYRFDEQKVSDLQQIQYQIVSYWQGQGKLPMNINMLSDAISGYQVPTDPQSGKPYEYSIMGPITFQLCATFNEVSRPGQAPIASAPTPYPASSGKPLADNWQHDLGRACFLRTIDPNRYPVTQKPTPKPL